MVSGPRGQKEDPVRVTPLIAFFSVLFAGPAFWSWAEDPPPANPSENLPPEPHPPAGLLDPRDFPVGITVLAPIPTPTGPVSLIKVRTNPDDNPVPSAPVLVIAYPQLIPPRPPLAAPKARNLVPGGTWAPTSAWPLGNPERAYPWNPAVFSAASPAWTPTSAWPEGQDARNWSPVAWSRPVFDPVWIPQDSWNGKAGWLEEAQAP